MTHRPSKTQIVRQLTQALDETEPDPQRILRVAYDVFGPEVLLEVLADAQVQHAQGVRRSMAHAAARWAVPSCTC